MSTEQATRWNKVQNNTTKHPLKQERQAHTNYKPNCSSHPGSSKESNSCDEHGPQTEARFTPRLHKNQCHDETAYEAEPVETRRHERDHRDVNRQSRKLRRLARLLRKREERKQLCEALDDERHCAEADDDVNKGLVEGLLQYRLGSLLLEEKKRHIRTS